MSRRGEAPLAVSLEPPPLVVEVEGERVRIAGRRFERCLLDDGVGKTRHPFEALVGGGDDRVARDSAEIELDRAEAAHGVYQQSPARRRDHLGDPDQALDDSVRDYVQQHGGQRPAGPIRLLTHMRYFGYRFNPVSLFYCFDAADKQVETIVAEITNTPWGERYPYVLTENLNCGSTDKKRYHLAKDFHISPFMGMDQRYAWRFTAPGSHLAVYMENYEHDIRLFDATMTLKHRVITGRALAGALLRYPLITARVSAAIYWQAARLYLKKCPFHPHPKSMQAETAR